jgi:hypothetical protein
MVDGADPDLIAEATSYHLDNPACRVPFGAAELVAEWEGERLVLDLEHGVRLEPESGISSGTAGEAAR